MASTAKRRTREGSDPAGRITRQASQALVVAAAFAAIYFIWGSTYLAIKVAVESVPPLLLAGTRSVVAGLLLYGWARSRGAGTPTRARWRDGLAAGALLFFGAHGAIFWASQHVPSGLVAVLVSTVPLWVALLETLPPYRATLMPTGLFGLVLGIVGIAWLHVPATGSRVLPGVSLVLIAGAAAWALGTVWYRGHRRPESGLMAAALPLLGGGTLLLLVAGLRGEPLAVSVDDIGAEVVLALLYLVVCGSLVGFSAYSWLLTVVPATKVASYAYVNPVVALFLGWAVAGEELTAAAFPPVAMVLTAVVMLVAGEAGGGDAAEEATGRASAERKRPLFREGAASTECPPCRERPASTERPPLSPEETAIARSWLGRTRVEDGEEYLRLLERTGVRDCLATEGNRGVLVLRHREGDEARFWFVSLWDSMDAVRRFAGDDPARARYYEEDREYLLELPPRVDHWEVALGGLPPAASPAPPEPTDPERRPVRRSPTAPCGSSG